LADLGRRKVSIMRIGGHIQGVTLTLIIAVFALVLGACEGGRKLPSVVGYQLSNKTASPTNNPNAKPAPLSLDDALAQLDALAKPESVDAALWGQLTSAFRTALRARGEKITAAAPSSESSRVSDLAFSDDGAGNLVLKWHYRNMGDYDQNGTVGIPDVTPIAMYYGYSYSPADVNSVLAVIDGNGNGVVDIADITPLAMNFGAQCVEYALEDATGEGGDYAEVARIPLPEAASGERILLSAPHVLDPARPFVRVVPYDSAGAAGIPSAVLHIAGGKPHITSVYPWFAVSGTEQQFVPYVDGDAPLYYSWDFGGGATPNTSSERMPTVTIGAPGAYNAKLTVSNIFGSEECAFTLTTGVPPEITSVSPIEGDFESQTTFSAIVVGTEPFTTYAWDFGGGATPNTSVEASPTVTLGVMGDYAASLTVSSHFGTDTYQFNLHVLGWHIELVDGDGPFGNTISLKLDADGLPHVAYTYEPPLGIGYYLKYAYMDGIDWHVEAVDDEGDTGLNPSLALDSLGLPHISYYDERDAAYQPTEDLNYASFDGSSWTIEVVDSEGNEGSSSLVIDSLDRPHIAYYGSPDSEAGHLRYAWYDGGTWQIETADGADWVGDVCSLALDSLDRPHISYLYGVYNNVKYAYYDGAGWQVETADSEKGTGYGSIALALDSLDLPHIGYGLGGVGPNGIIRDIKYSFYDGLEWHNELLDFTNRVIGPSLALDSHDRPGIAFRDMDARSLMYTNLVGGVWRTQTIDSSPGEDPSVVIDEQDRPCVCYYVEGAVNKELKYAAYF
jgi:hypothetical protein